MNPFDDENSSAPQEPTPESNEGLLENPPAVIEAANEGPIAPVVSEPVIPVIGLAEWRIAFTTPSSATAQTSSGGCDSKAPK